MNPVLRLACLLASSVIIFSLMFCVFERGRDEGFSDGMEKGFERGVKSLKPSIVIVKPPCMDGKSTPAEEQDSVLWRI